MNVSSEWVTKDVLNLLKENILLVGSFQTKRISTNPPTWQWMGNWKLSCKIDVVNGTVHRFCIVWKWIWSEDIKVDVKLTFIEPLQIESLSEFCNYIKSSDGQEIIRNGCLRSCAADAIKIERTLLPSLDNFQDINYHV